jgi:hypothetical protein
MKLFSLLLESIYDLVFICGLILVCALVGCEKEQNPCNWSEIDSAKTFWTYRNNGNDVVYYKYFQSGANQTYIIHPQEAVATGRLDGQFEDKNGALITRPRTLRNMPPQNIRTYLVCKEIDIFQ